MMKNVRDYVGYQYELAELQGKINNWSTVYDDDYGVDMDDFYTGAFDRIASRYGNNPYSVDWQDEAFGGHATTQNHNVSISTGTEKPESCFLTTMSTRTVFSPTMTIAATPFARKSTPNSGKE